MGRKSSNTVAMDENGVELGTQMLANETVEKKFTLSRKTNWPTETVDGVERPLSLSFTVVIDMKGIGYQQILDDAIRTKVITLQNALKGTGQKQVPFEVVEAISKQGKLYRHYDTVGQAPENPEKDFQNVMSSVGNLTPEMRAKLLEELMSK